MHKSNSRYKNEENHMIKTTSENAVYVVDSQFHIMAYNQVLHQEFPALQKGLLCYQALRGRSCPCNECPLIPSSSNNHIFFDSDSQRWLELCSGQIEWPEAGTCSMILICEIQGPKVQELQLPSIEPSSSIDPFTGLLKRTAFFQAATDFLAYSKGDSYCLMSIDIEHFKLFNQWYGHEKGDQFLQKIAEYLKKQQAQHGGVAGYMGDDDFCFLLPNSQKLLDQIQMDLIQYSRTFGGNAGFYPAFGVYAIEDISTAVNVMYDRATLAQSSVKGNYAQRLRWYDVHMTEQMEETHRLLSEFQRALENQEFTFYLQPKCNMSTGKIVGFESLVRWIHPERGLIPPGEFIPLLENNGFIATLDLYLWEQVCACIRDWLDQGLRVLPISVNVSRVDIYTLDVTQCLVDLIYKYRLDPRMLEVEITESAYVEDYEVVPKLIEKLRNSGFAVLMDDFGSGYSSLNMLKDVNVDVLKIDMKFLEMDSRNVDKGVGILEAVVSMARLLGLRIIAEGLETQEQVNFLLNIGCIYGQGYYFYHPLPLSEIMPLVSNTGNLDFRGIKAQRMQHLKLKELLNENLLSETMVSNILGAIAFYDVYDLVIKPLRVNDQYYRVTGTNPIDLAEEQTSILQYVYEMDRPIVFLIFEDAYLNKLHGAEGDFRRLKNNGDTVWIHLRVYFLKKQDNHKFFYAALSDVTDEIDRKRALDCCKRTLLAAANVPGQNSSLMKLTERNRRAAASLYDQLAPGGTIGAYCDDKFTLYFANNAIVKLMGYRNYDEMSLAMDGIFVNTIHPDDRQQFFKAVGPNPYAGLEYTTSYRMVKKDGGWFWVVSKGRVVSVEDGRLAIVSGCADITESIMAQQQLSERSALLIRQNQELNFLHNDMPGGYHRCAPTPDFDFLYISNRFLEIFGYTRDEIHDLFDDKFVNMVHPDDRPFVSDEINRLRHKRSRSRSLTLKCRLLGKHGYLWVIDQTRYVRSSGNIFLQGVATDITETVKLRNKMQLLTEHIPENILLATYKDHCLTHSLIADGLFRDLGLSLEDYQELLHFPPAQKSMEHRELLIPYQKLLRSLEKKQSFEDLFHVSYPLGKDLWISLNARYIGETEDGLSYLCVYKDLTTLKQKERELWITHKKLETILRQGEINSLDWDLRRKTLTLSNVTSHNTLDLIHPQLNTQPVVIKNFPSILLDHQFLVPNYKKKFENFLSQICKNRSSVAERCEIPIQTKDGQIIWFEVVCSAILDETGTPISVVGYYVDITDRKRQELHLTRMAETDALTGLYNRQTAIPKIKRYLENRGDETSALIMFDLDNFKAANDVFGHVYGDDMISQNAQKLKNFFRSQDIICRIGGDEFLILCKNIDEKNIEKKLSLVLQSMVISQKKLSQELLFTVSAGYAMIPEQGLNFDELYKKADIALFTAKMNGKGTFFKYASCMKEIRYELAKPDKP